MFFTLSLLSRVFREDKENSLVEMREETRKRSAMADMQMTRKMIGEPGPGLDFWVLGKAIVLWGGLHHQAKPYLFLFSRIWTPACIYHVSCRTLHCEIASNQLPLLKRRTIAVISLHRAVEY